MEGQMSNESLDQQRQQRWLLRVDGSQVGILMRDRGGPTHRASQHIRDWFHYPHTPQGLMDPARAVRFRQIDRGPVTVTIKRALDEGERRSVYTVSVDPSITQALGHPSLEKKRYTLEDERFTLDIYQNPSLRGIAILEQRLQSSDTPAPLPEWTRLFAPLNVTHALTASHLALIHEPGDILTSQARIMERLGLSVPTIVLTGAPCSGKTTIIDHVAAHLPRFRVVPEAATIAIVHLRCHPPAHGDDAVGSMRFQRTIRDIQLLFEGIARQTATHEREQAVLLDRGVADGHAYLSGDPNIAYQLYFHTTLNEDHKRYKAVIHLAPPPREAFEANRRNNPARRESYEEVLALDGRIAQAWSGHRHYLRVGEGQSWDDKFTTALKAIESFAH